MINTFFLSLRLKDRYYFLKNKVNRKAKYNSAKIISTVKAFSLHFCHLVSSLIYLSTSTVLMTVTLSVWLTVSILSLSLYLIDIRVKKTVSPRSNIKILSVVWMLSCCIFSTYSFLITGTSTYRITSRTLQPESNISNQSTSRKM